MAVVREGLSRMIFCFLYFESVQSVVSDCDGDEEEMGDSRQSLHKVAGLSYINLLFCGFDSNFCAGSFLDEVSCP